MHRPWLLPALPLSTALICFFVARSRTLSPEPQELRFDGARALRDVEALVAAFGPRPPGGPRQRESAKWIADRFEADGVDARVSSGTVRGRPVHNAIAMLSGRTDRFLVVLGHHDTVPDGPGAEDNASSVAALLELARALRGRPLRHAVILCATDYEEAGGAGAELLIADLGKERIRNTDACVGLEMLGWPGGSPVMHAIPKNYAAEAAGYVPAALPATIQAAAPVHVPLGDPKIPLVAQGFTRLAGAKTGSDDVFFLREGVPALFLSRSSLTGFYPHYHKSTDTPDKLSAEALQSSGRILEAAVLALDGAPPIRESPQNYLLWRGAVFTVPLLAVVSGASAASCLGFALWSRPRDRVLAVGAGLAFLPALSCTVRFQPLVLVAAWPAAALLPAVAAPAARWARRALAALAALPALLTLGAWATGAAMFGVELPAGEVMPLLLGAGFATAGAGLASRGLPAAGLAPGRSSASPPPLPASRSAARSSPTSGSSATC